MRTLIRSLVIAGVAGLALAVPVAVATAAPAPAQVADVQFLGTYSSLEVCQAAGAEAVLVHGYVDYICLPSVEQVPFEAWFDLHAQPV